MKQPSAYHSYLLRMWLASGKDRSVWCASLENARTGERLGFASLVELFDYLCQQTSGSPTKNAALAEIDDT